MYSYFIIGSVALGMTLCVVYAVYSYLVKRRDQK